MLPHSDPRSSVRVFFFFVLCRRCRVTGILGGHTNLRAPQPSATASEDLTKRWETIEFNIRGTYNLVQNESDHRLANMVGTHVSAFGSEYCTSKHALIRFAAFVTISEILYAHSTIRAVGVNQQPDVGRRVS